MCKDLFTFLHTNTYTTLQKHNSCDSIFISSIYSNIVENCTHINGPKAAIPFREFHTLHRRWDSMNSQASSPSLPWFTSYCSYFIFPWAQQIFIFSENLKSQVAHHFAYRCFSMYFSEATLVC